MLGGWARASGNDAGARVSRLPVRRGLAGTPLPFFETRLGEQPLEVCGLGVLRDSRGRAIVSEQVRCAVRPQHPGHLAKRCQGLAIANPGNARNHAIEGSVGEGESLAAPRLELNTARDAP